MGDDADDTVFVLEILLITIPTHSFERVLGGGNPKYLEIEASAFFFFCREYAPTKRLDWLNLLPVLFHVDQSGFIAASWPRWQQCHKAAFCLFEIWSIFSESVVSTQLDPSQRHWLVAQFSDQQKTYWKSSWRSICKISDLWPHQSSCLAKLLSKVRQVKCCHNSTQLQLWMTPSNLKSFKLSQTAEA